MNIQSTSIFRTPYGMVMPNRNNPGGDYRYGFQNQEVDPEIKGEGNSVNYKYRMHDPRVGRFFAVDPLTAHYPFNSPYAFSENVVINAVELEGLEKEVLTSNNDYSWGPLAEPTMLDNVQSKPLESVVTHYEIRKAFVKLYLGSMSFVANVKEQDVYSNVTITPDYVWDGAVTKGNPTYSDDDRVSFEETEIVIGLGASGVAHRLAYEMTNSKNYLNGKYAELIDKAYFNKDFTKAQYVEEASLIESEARFGEIVAIGELMESRGVGTYTYKNKGNSVYMKDFEGMTLEKLGDNKAEFIKAFSEQLAREGSNTRQNYDEEYDIITMGE